MNLDPDNFYLIKPAKIWYFGAFLACLFIWSCNYDVIVPSPNMLQCDEAFSYDTQISEIINRNCAYAGCHDGSSSVPGNFIDYEGLFPRISNGQFEARVINQQDMPPSSSSGPTMLTASEIDDLKCWLRQGFPEK